MTFSLMIADKRTTWFLATKALALPRLTAGLRTILPPARSSFMAQTCALTTCHFRASPGTSGRFFTRSRPRTTGCWPIRTHWSKYLKIWAIISIRDLVPSRPLSFFLTPRRGHQRFSPAFLVYFLFKAGGTEGISFHLNCNTAEIRPIFSVQCTFAKVTGVPAANAVKLSTAKALWCEVF